MRSIIDASPEVRRISTDPNDTAFRADYRDFIVLLNGKIVHYVHSADIVTGEVVSTLTNERGHPIASEDNWVLRKRTGNVQIRRQLTCYPRRVHSRIPCLLRKGNARRK